jgi:LysR family glycine cleavage system transcriptional activator
VNWFERRGIEVEKPLMVTQMPGNLIMQSVRRGDGITYTSRAFFRNEIDAGQVKVLYSEPVFGVYCLETNPSTSRPAVRKFINWIMSNAEIVTV